jgi:hypothetical protein
MNLVFLIVTTDVKSEMQDLEALNQIITENLDTDMISSFFFFFSRGFQEVSP